MGGCIGAFVCGCGCGCMCVWECVLYIVPIQCFVQKTPQFDMQILSLIKINDVFNTTPFTLHSSTPPGVLFVKSLPYLCFTCLFPKTLAALHVTRSPHRGLYTKNGRILSCLSPNSNTKLPSSGRLKNTTILEI